MRSRVNIKGHPVHTMLLVVPAGGFMLVLAFDLLYLLGAGDMWWEATVPLLIGALAGGMLASIPGAIDLYTSIRSDRALNIAIAHGVTAFVLLAVGAINLTIRIDAAAGEANWAVWWSVVGFAVLVITGALGGHMVYRHGVAISAESDEEQPVEHREGADKKKRKPPRHSADELGSPI